MAAGEIHVGDVGTLLQVTVLEGAALVDISTATVKQFKLKKPNGTIVTKTAVFATDGTDGKLNYVTISNDLDTDGPWRMQALITTPAGVWSSDEISFDVYPNLS